VTADDVRAFAAGALASFKVPSHVEFLDELPHNATGKVLKHLLGTQTSLDAAGLVEE
jgi:acyl-CoA synthetase (AMP-forming)/AMP-acid ligase II